MNNVLKINQKFINLDIKDLLSKTNNFFMITFLYTLFSVQKNQLELDMNEVDFWKRLTKSQKRTLIKKIEAFKINALDSSSKSITNIYNVRGNIIKIKRDTLDRILFKDSKGIYINISEKDFNRINKYYSDLDILVLLYQKFADKSNLFKNKSFKFIENRLPLTDEQKKKLYKSKLVELSNKTNIKMKTNNFKFSFEFNRSLEKKCKKQNNSNPFSILEYNKFFNTYNNNINLDEDLLFKSFHIISSGYNTFLTGVAGSGKTTLIKSIINLYKNKGKKVVKLSPTAISAQQIEGNTFHSLLRMRDNLLTWEDVKKAHKGKDYSIIKEKLENADVIILDEFGMVSEALFNVLIDALNEFNCIHKKQFIFTGDPGQLKPVYTSEQFKKYGEIVYKKAMFSNNFENMDIFHVHLIETKRATDSQLVDLLSNTRKSFKNKVFNSLKEANKAKVADLNPNDTIILSGKNSNVNNFNLIFQNQNQNKSYVFENEVYTHGLNSNLTLKINDPVIITQNVQKTEYKLFNNKIKEIRKTPARCPLPNNTLGTFIGVYQDKPIIKLRNKNQYIVLMKPVSFYNYQSIDNKKNSKDKVWPIKLAYAITVHKAQGLTISDKKVFFDINSYTFENQSYTALSRIRKFDQIIVPENIEYNMIKDNIGFEHSSDLDRFKTFLKNNERSVLNFSKKLINKIKLPQELTFDNVGLLSRRSLRLPIYIKDYKNNICNIKTNFNGIKIDNFGNIYIAKENELFKFLKENKDYIYTSNGEAERIILLALSYSASDETEIKILIDTLSQKLIKRYNRFILNKNNTEREFDYLSIKKVLNKTDIENVKELFMNFDYLYQEIEKSSFRTYTVSVFNKVFEKINPSYEYNSFTIDSVEESILMGVTTIKMLDEIASKLYETNNYTYWFTKFYNKSRKLLMEFFTSSTSRKNNINLHNIFWFTLLNQTEENIKIYKKLRKVVSLENSFKNKNKYISYYKQEITNQGLENLSPIFTRVKDVELLQNEQIDIAQNFKFYSGTENVFNLLVDTFSDVRKILRSFTKDFNAYSGIF